MGPSSWSRDGTGIAFARDLDIWIMNADGSNQVNLTRSNGQYDQSPAWSSDGTHIAFDSYDLSEGNQDIYVINADGTGKTRLTYTSGPDYGPTWSPNGTKIAFWSHRDLGDI